jgi:hypothetical protein
MFKTGGDVSSFGDQVEMRCDESSFSVSNGKQVVRNGDYEKDLVVT